MDISEPVVKSAALHVVSLKPAESVDDAKWGFAVPREPARPLLAVHPRERRPCVGPDGVHIGHEGWLGGIS